MRAREYFVLTRAIEEALPGAIRRFDKHRDTVTVPEELVEELADDLADAVINAISEVFTFDGAPCDE